MLEVELDVAQRYNESRELCVLCLECKHDALQMSGVR